MGATLVMADQMRAYALTDRGTYLKFKHKIDLRPLVTSSERLRNPYGVIVVNPDKHSRVNAGLARAFADFMISREAQGLIRDYKIEGEQLFHPLRIPDEH
jgi:tungstate transport system substrate-binding protein